MGLSAVFFFRSNYKIGMPTRTVQQRGGLFFYQKKSKPPYSEAAWQKTGFDFSTWPIGRFIWSLVFVKKKNLCRLPTSGFWEIPEYHIAQRNAGQCGQYDLKGTSVIMYIAEISTPPSPKVASLKLEKLMS